MTTIDTTAAPTVILNDDTAPGTEASETTAKFNAIVGYTPIDYPALTDLEVLDGFLTGATDRIRNRHWAEFDKRVRPVVEATARKLLADEPNDRDDAVNFAIAKVMELHEHKKVVNAVRRGEKLANCIAAFVRQNSTQAAVGRGRHLNAAGGKTTTAAPKEERKLITVDFTADETLRSIDGNAYTMDPLDDALDRELHGVPTDGEVAREWFEQVLSRHNVTLTQRELDALFHSAGITPEVTGYLDNLAAEAVPRALAVQALDALLASKGIDRKALQASEENAEDDAVRAEAAAANDALLESSGIHRQTLDEVKAAETAAIKERGTVARAIGAAEPNPRAAAKRAGAPRLPQEHVAAIVGVNRSTVSRDVDSAENAIFAVPALVREGRRGSDERRRVTFEDITTGTVEWLKTFAYQAGIVADEATVLGLPYTYWTDVMDDYGYDVDDYNARDLNRLIGAVIAGVVA